MPQPAPEPAPMPAPAPPPPSADWRDWAMTPGGWRYAQEGANSSAAFGQPGAQPLVTIRCETAARRILLILPGARAAGQMTVRTSFGVANWPIQVTSETGPFIAARAASDPVLDQIAFSRGRFVLEVTGTVPLVLPTWAEIARVVEDCRG